MTEFQKKGNSDTIFDVFFLMIILLISRRVAHNIRFGSYFLSSCKSTKFLLFKYVHHPTDWRDK